MFCVLQRYWTDIWDCDKEDFSALCWVATAACVIIAGYFGGLQGKEINKIDLSVTQRYWKGSTQHVEYSQVPLMLSRKFKKQKGLKLFCQPLALGTNAGRHLEEWFSCIVRP